MILTLYTERLVLRPFEPADAPRVRELASAPEVAKTTLNIPHPYPEGATEAWIATHAESAAAGASYTWAVTLHGSGEVAGTITIRTNADYGRADLGYWLGVKYWNKGYMTEAAWRVVEWGFGDLRPHRVEAMCLPRNRGSSRVDDALHAATTGVRCRLPRATAGHSRECKAHGDCPGGEREEYGTIKPLIQRGSLCVVRHFSARRSGKIRATPRSRAISYSSGPATSSRSRRAYTPSCRSARGSG